MTRDPEQRLDDIEDAITQIRAGMAALDSGVPGSQADLARDAVLYRLLVIGEAAKALPDPVRGCVPDLPWRNIMRLLRGASTGGGVTVVVPRSRSARAMVLALAD